MFLFIQGDPKSLPYQRFFDLYERMGQELRRQPVVKASKFLMTDNTNFRMNFSVLPYQKLMPTVIRKIKSNVVLVHRMLC